MLYKQLGKTGKKVSAVGFGTMRFRPDDYANDNFDKCADMIIRGAELGINYFDTAPDYCDDKAELILGHALKQMKNRPYISTKCGLWNATTKDGARKLIEQQLKNLCSEKINFYHMWCIKNIGEYNEFTKKGGVYEGLLKAKEEGLIEHICCSAHMSGKEIKEIAEGGLVESITLGYNALNFAYRREGIKACHDAGMGVVIMNPLGGGMIPRHPELFSFLSEGKDESVVTAALKFLIGQKEISVAMPGIFTMEHLEECAGAAEGDIPEVTDAKLEELKKEISDKLDSLCTGCSYCDDCPAGLPVPKLMDSFNELIVTGEMRYVSRRLNNFWNVKSELAEKCTECGKCESLCTQKLPIIERLKAIAGESR